MKPTKADIKRWRRLMPMANGAVYRALWVLVRSRRKLR